MRLEWIEDLLAVHDTGSLRAAADIRFLTASAFTRRIKAVEDALGGELFDRSNKPLTLRPHVLEAIPNLRDAAASLRSLQSQLGGLKETQKRTRLICQHTLSVSWAPRVAKALSEKGKSIRVRSGGRDACLLGILKADSDVAIVYDDPESIGSETEDLFDRIHFGKEEFIPVAASYETGRLVHMIENREFSIVSYPRNLFLGQVLERALSKKPATDLTMSVVAEAGLGPAVLEFVREGIGVGWLPSSMLFDELRSGEFTSLTHFFPAFELDIVALKSSRDRSKASTAIWDEISRRFGS